MSLRDVNRRGFIKGTGAGAAAMLGFGGLTTGAMASQGEGPRAIGQPMPNRLALPETPPTRPSEDSLGYAIVGLGGYSLRQIMPRIGEARRSHIAALVSGNPEKLSVVGDAYGVPQRSQYSYENFDEIAADESVDAVYIVLPSGLHCEYTERAFAAGKHVLCEKPMAVSSAECDRMIAAGERAGKKLMMGYRCHFEPYNLKAMELMREEALGDLRLIRTTHTNRFGQVTPEQNWRLARKYAGGGPLEDVGIYGLQAALYLSGEMPESLSAAAYSPAGDPRFTEILALVSAQLNFPSGLNAQIATSYDSIGKNAVDVYGSGGALMMNPATGYGGHTMELRNWQSSEVLTPGDPGVQFMRQLDHFADAIRDGSEILVPGEMGRRDIRLIEAIYRSAAEGRTLALNPDGTVRG